MKKVLSVLLVLLLAVSVFAGGSSETAATASETICTKWKKRPPSGIKKLPQKKSNT